MIDDKLNIDKPNDYQFETSDETGKIQVIFTCQFYGEVKGTIQMKTGEILCSKCFEGKDE